MTYEIKGIKCATNAEAQQIKLYMIKAYKELGEASLNGDDTALSIYYANKQIGWMHAQIKEVE